MENYIPPFDITNEMLEKCFGIMEDLGKLSGINEMERFPRLRRVSRVKSIHSSLAIENNTLSIGQVTDIVEGKRVLGPADDILAVKNAIEAYKMIDEVDPFRMEDLLKVHGVMMGGLVDEAGRIRTGNVGVFGEKGNVIHTAPSYKLVHELMGQLFDWIKNADVQMLIKSSVFHYEFEFIHPFRDGNGRMSRLLSLLLLYKNGFDAGKYVSFEEQINKYKDLYYDALQKSSSGWDTNENNYFPFIQNFLMTLYMCYKELDKRFAVVHGKRVTKAGRIEATILGSLIPISKAEICSIHPDISPTTIEAVLGKMVREGQIKQIGASRSTRYIRKNW